MSSQGDSFASGPGFWGVVVLALLITVLVGATGHWSGGFWVALGVFVIIGTLAPIVGLVLGGPILLYLVFAHGKPFLANVQNLISPAQPQFPSRQSREA